MAQYLSLPGHVTRMDDICPQKALLRQEIRCFERLAMPRETILKLRVFATGNIELENNGQNIV